MKKIVCFYFILNIVFVTKTYSDIFGRDDRKEIGSIRTSSKKEISRSVAVGVLASLWIDEKNDFKTLSVNSTADFMCKNERFYNQPMVFYPCSGFLVGKDLLVTAGHCATNYEEIHHSSEGYCKVFTWMFDYVEGIDVSKVPSKSIYTCKEIIYAVRDENPMGRDFALIRLDRPVLGRKPLKISEKIIKKNSQISMFGFPMGIPMKYTDNAYVFESKKDMPYSLTNLDAFGGNSGSPVLEKNDQVVGVLVAGNPSAGTYYDSRSKCERFNSCDNQGRNCKELTILDNGEGFPNTYSKIQKIQDYLSLIRKNL